MKEVLCCECRCLREYTLHTRWNGYDEKYATCNSCGNEITVPGLDDENMEVLERMKRKNKEYWPQDITWCCKDDCKEIKCMRNPIHILNNSIPHSFAYMEGTEDCYKENSDD